VKAPKVRHRRSDTAADRAAEAGRRAHPDCGPRDQAPDAARPSESATRADGRRGSKLQPRARSLSSLVTQLRTAHAKVSARNAELLDTQRRLNELVELYFDLYDSAPVAYVTLDHYGVIEQINLAGCRLFGTDREHLLGRPLVARVAPAERRAFLDHMRQCRARRGLVETELHARGSGGEAIPICISSHVTSFDKAVAYRTVLIDLRERERLEEERARVQQEEERARAVSEAKDRFIAMLSHELRTPLTPALFASARLLELDGLSEDAQHLLAVIRRNIELEARLIDDLLDLTRVRSGKLSLATQPVDVHRVIAEAVEVCQVQLRAKQQTLSLDLRANASIVCGDATRLRQVFWNLLENAIKFSKAGGRIEVRTEDAPNGRVRATMRDWGAGFDPSDRARLFRPFEQAGRERRRGSGLGLGLSICKGILEAHEGTIDAASPGLGHGATFVVELGAVCEETDREPFGLPRQQQAIGEKLRILLVEDDLDSGEMLMALLSHSGHEVALVRSAAQALQRTSDIWDVVISDIGLPDASGLEVGRRFRQAAGDRVVLVAMSGYGTVEDIHASECAGFDEHLVKPVDFPKLLATLRRPVAG
jgi:PAS domain S-box-containing protein